MTKASVTVRNVVYKSPENKEKSFETSVELHYFKDYVIQEVSGVRMISDSNGKDSIWITTEPPVLVQLKKMEYYRFSSFSDTARISYQFTKSDTLRFGIPIEPDKVLEYQKKRSKPNAERKADTVINGIPLQQYLVTVTDQRYGQTIEQRRIMFFRCDISQLPYRLDKPLDQEVGCICVRTDLPGMSVTVDAPAKIIFKNDKRIIRHMIRQTKNYKGNPPDKKQGLSWIN